MNRFLKSLRFGLALSSFIASNIGLMYLCIVSAIWVGVKLGITEEYAPALVAVGTLAFLTIFGAFSYYVKDKPTKPRRKVKK